MIDIHCHMLPGIDDGPENWDHSLALARRAVEAGIQAVVLTPHFIPGVYNWKLERGLTLHASFRNQIVEASLPLRSYLAAEVGVFPELVEWIPDGRVPLMPTGKHLLLETPMFGGKAMIKDVVFSILSLGITPILAHPERSALFSDPEMAGELVETKAELQLDAGSLLGQWGDEIQKTSFDLIDHGWVMYVASDSHGIGQRDPLDLRRTAQLIEKRWGSMARDSLTRSNPEKLLGKR